MSQQAKSKMRANGHRSRKGTNGKVIGAKHNDRNFDVSKADHIEESLIEKNVIWKYVDLPEVGEDETAVQKSKPETLDEYEQRVYEMYFAEALKKRNEKQVKDRHKDRVQTMEQYRHNAKFCPEESIWNIGNRDNSADPETMKKCWEEFVEWHKATYPNAMLLDATLHLDEPDAAPHIHCRNVWVVDADEHLQISQKDALKAMGIQSPDPSKKPTRHNNPKMTYTALTREKWQEIAESHGLEIEREPQEKSRSGLTLLQLKRRTLEEKIEGMERELTTLDAKCEESDADLRKLTTQEQEKEAEIAKVTERLEAVERQIKDYQKQQSDLESDVQKLAGKKVQLQSDVEQATLKKVSEFLTGKGSKKVAAAEAIVANADEVKKAMTIEKSHELAQVKKLTDLLQQKEKQLDKTAQEQEQTAKRQTYTARQQHQREQTLSQREEALHQGQRQLAEQQEKMKWTAKSQARYEAEKLLAGGGYVRKVNPDQQRLMQSQMHSQTTREQLQQAHNADYENER